MQQREANLEHLMTWISVRVCSKKCGLDVRMWEHIDNSCKSDCSASLRRLRQASMAIQPGEEVLINFPLEDSSVMELHDSNDKTQYNGMMFAGGVKVGGSTTFVARLCTHHCHVGDPFFDSTLVLGGLEQSRKPDENDSRWHWKEAAEHWVPHDDGRLAKGDYSGPEDPRMDVLLGSRFLTVSMNVPRKQVGCGSSPIGIHHMFFVPVDKPGNLKACDIQVPGLDPCSVQKNWASLVPKGSKDVYYVYSIRPLQMMRFQPSSCQASWLAGPGSKQDHPLQFDATYAVHGGTRYVFGGHVSDGDLFWSVGHTPASANYMPVIVALIMRNATTPQEYPHFELMGVSCPIKISKKFVDPTSPSDETWEKRMLITTSVVDFDLEADVSTLTYQVHDRDNYRSQLFGVGAWLQVAYKEFRSGTVFSCDQLH